MIQRHDPTHHSFCPSIMSSPNKRRKVGAPVTAEQNKEATGGSAASALAARRQKLVSGGSDHGHLPEIRTCSNPFAALQTPRPKRGKSSQGAGNGLHRGSEVESERVLYSSFCLSERNHRLHHDRLELNLGGAERFLLVGSCGVRVLKGEVTVAGAVLGPSRNVVWMHAPLCHAIPVLRTVGNTRLELHDDPEAEGLRRLGRLSPLFQNLWNDGPSGGGQVRPRGPTSFQFLGDSEDAPRGPVIQQLVCPPAWNMKLASIVESASQHQPSVLVCGPKSSGKSTFSRMLTNRLLTVTHRQSGVAVLDLDPGQAEYGPPGTVSLVRVRQPNLGVPFTHPGVDDGAYEVVRCHSLASVDPASMTELHLECAVDLYDYHRHTLGNCPLVVNTPGWIFSLGLEFLLHVIDKVRPVDVVYMSEDGPAETVEALGGATRSLALLPSQPSEARTRTAAQMREMQTMSYFHTVQTKGSMRLGWSSRALSSVRPVVVPYSGRRRGFRGIMRYDYQLPVDLTAEAINGMVLAVVEVESLQAFRGHSLQHSLGPSDGVDDGSDPAALFSPEGIPVIPNPDDVGLDPRHSRTIGLVLVRGVDTANRCLQMLTPMPLGRLQQARDRGSSIVLVHGKMEAPTWSYTEHLYERSDELKQVESCGGTDDEDSHHEGAADGVGTRGDESGVPWVEVFRGDQKRPVGSKVWRVRRDLGRGSGA
ncbi:Polynucleotide 5'-hydroxyl-kinase GRC3 [Ophiocordyceps camponoti-floridani]|uniref:Polynucleotide 5'-hydroxyl-kinase GRC3 n=1 Tax=Ophiocordyceps camponoti-floridani TaxID=2030778 RepID=A0A8H4VCW1_9HYPO|nr:Polynucleotide 5'-hydroxyl-kinase GRC3 [Ophiocordyceps camponoti-floridani]